MPGVASGFALESPSSPADNEALGNWVSPNHLRERPLGVMLALGKAWVGLIFDASLSQLVFFPGSAMGFFPTPAALKESENFSSFLRAGCCQSKSGLSSVTWELPLGRAC